MKKTNAMRMLEQGKVPFDVSAFDVDEEHLDGITASKELGVSPQRVYKTLVVEGEHQVGVCLVAVDQTVDLKALARAMKVKRVDMVALSDLTRLTGYQRGGCSPIGMRREYPTFIDEAALAEETILVNAGARGQQLVIAPAALIDFVGMTVGNFTQD